MRILIRSLFRPAIGVLATVAAILALAPYAHAELVAYQVTGSLNGFDYDDINGAGDENGENATNFQPVGSAPWEGGEPYRTIFIVDDTASLSGTGSNEAVYLQAVQPLMLFVRAQNPPDVLLSNVPAVLTENIRPGSAFSAERHRWVVSAGNTDPDLIDTIPTFSVFDSDLGVGNTVSYDSFTLFLSDEDGMLYSQNPPELVAPDASEFSPDFSFVEVRFRGAAAHVGIAGSVETVKVPEPSFSALLLIGSLALSLGTTQARQ